MVTVFLVDLSGGVDSLKTALGRWLRRPVRRLKPFDCSLCVFHWTALAVMLHAGRLNLGCYAAICLLAFATTITKEALILILRAIIWLISRVNV